MADFICHGCNSKKPQSSVKMCEKCHKILCYSCGSSAHCKDNAKGTAGCSGWMKTP